MFFEHLNPSWFSQIRLYVISDAEFNERNDLPASLSPSRMRWSGDFRLGAAVKSRLFDSLEVAEAGALTRQANYILSTQNLAAYFEANQLQTFFPKCQTERSRAEVIEQVVGVLVETISYISDDVDTIEEDLINPQAFIDLIATELVFLAQKRQGHMLLRLHLSPDRTEPQNGF